MFKPTICLFVLAVASGAVSGASIGGKLINDVTTEKREIIPLLSFEVDKKPDGSFHFQYEGGDRSYREETGSVSNAGTDEEAIEVQGSYRYIDADGQEVVVHYTAGKNGYVPIGTNIPAEISNLAKAAANLPEYTEEQQRADRYNQRRARSKSEEQQPVEAAKTLVAAEPVQAVAPVPAESVQTKTVVAAEPVPAEASAVVAAESVQAETAVPAEAAKTKTVVAAEPVQAETVGAAESVNTETVVPAESVKTKRLVAVDPVPVEAEAVVAAESVKTETVVPAEPVQTKTLVATEPVVAAESVKTETVVPADSKTKTLVATEPVVAAESVNTETVVPAEPVQAVKTLEQVNTAEPAVAASELVPVKVVSSLV
ncbi:uncharacterized protein LOC108652667 isoform X2 [Drosophila navojoa]|uniref:uncharacterized protein LOC108652667 isoform X2 n=1 Tax=Drosophila navojoa TaxID=7232 RepID=UPI0011BD706B|nr:uncharacterized protein LOC108652667 isoform X2 [Drosophila navojoa]